MGAVDAEFGDRVGHADIGTQGDDFGEIGIEIRAHAAIRRKPGDAGLDCAAVEDKHIRHQYGIGHAVMRVEQGAHRVSQRMHGAKPLLECGAAHGGRRHHMRARREVAAVADRDAQIFMNQTRPLDSDAIGHRVIARRAIGFEAMRQRIHPRAGRQTRRQAGGQHRIGDDDPGHHQRMENHLLRMRRAVGDHTGAPRLRTGARRGGHGDDRGNGVRVRTGPPIPDILEIP